VPASFRVRQTVLSTPHPAQETSSTAVTGLSALTRCLVRRSWRSQARRHDQGQTQNEHMPP
jgi:hypothetical protein